MIVMMKSKTLLIALLALSASGSAFAESQMTLGLNSGNQYLEECGGTIAASATDNGDRTQVNLVLRSVKNCSNFIILKDGREYKLQGQNGDRGGSFTLPQDAIDFGMNRVRLVVQSDSGKHKDQVTVRFRAY